MNVIKLLDNKFDKFVDLKKEFPNVNFPLDMSNYELPDGYAKVEYEQFSPQEGMDTNYSDIPVFENNKWILKIIYTPIKVIVPEVITPKQARLALLEIGKLDEVENMIVNAPIEIRRKLQIEWEFATEVYRYHEFITMLAPLINMSEEDVDNLFINGAKIK